MEKRESHGTHTLTQEAPPPARRGLLNTFCTEMIARSSFRPWQDYRDHQTSARWKRVNDIIFTTTKTHLLFANTSPRPTPKSPQRVFHLANLILIFKQPPLRYPGLYISAEDFTVHVDDICRSSHFSAARQIPVVKYTPTGGDIPVNVGGVRWIEAECFLDHRIKI